MYRKKDTKYCNSSRKSFCNLQVWPGSSSYRQHETDTHIHTHIHRESRESVIMFNSIRKNRFNMFLFFFTLNSYAYCIRLLAHIHVAIFVYTLVHKMRCLSHNTQQPNQLSHLRAPTKMQAHIHKLIWLFCSRIYTTKLQNWNWNIYIYFSFRFWCVFQRKKKHSSDVARTYHTAAVSLSFSVQQNILHVNKFN